MRLEQRASRESIGARGIARVIANRQEGGEAAAVWYCGARGAASRPAAGGGGRKSRRMSHRKPSCRAEAKWRAA